ncbi:uncharacterized protein LOC127755097 [Oryza glaberrima]|uniref:Uncharacterized protein n=1 Tax=Oryza glaberrima TaxID=4538 RepID=I1NM41_ORYGL|nr:uncharacterized protein LOC127755097 [Oryza glaberrima]
MAQQQRRRRRGGSLAVLLLLLLLGALLLSLSLLARVDAAAATVSSANLDWNEGEVAVATPLGQEAVAAAEEEGDRPPERVEMESINDYGQASANNRHNPHP